MRALVVTSSYPVRKGHVGGRFVADLLHELGAAGWQFDVVLPSWTGEGRETAPNVHLAERLCAFTGMQRAFFCNSGTEATEAALKLVRRHFFDLGQTARYRVIAFDNAFHGRTLGALSVTGQAKYREGFGPVGGVTHVEI